MKKMAAEEPAKKRKLNDGTAAAKEYFPGIGKIPFEGPKSENPLAFKYYNPEQMIQGRKMKDWLRFAVCWWHTFRGTGADMFGAPTQKRPWNTADTNVEDAKGRVDAAFEFFTKLGVEYYCFHDRDVSPQGGSLAETNKNLDEVTDYMKAKQEETGVKLLWGTANLFSDPRYMNGAGTNPDLHAFAYAAAQVKKAMEVTVKLGGGNYVFWGGREGYQSFYNSDVLTELDNFAEFLKMAVAWKEKLGTDFQLLIEPKPREPTKHQYDYDAQTVIGFLKHYGLDKDFKVNIEPNHTTLAGHDFEHDIVMASRYGMLGSIDCNTGDMTLGWDTDNFLYDPQDAAKVMLMVLRQGGLAPGGLNFDCKVRRESTDLEDLFIAHIGAMDVYAHGLIIADRIERSGKLGKMLATRYETWKSELGKKVQTGNASFEELELYALENGEPKQISGKEELFVQVFKQHCFESS